MFGWAPHSKNIVPATGLPARTDISVTPQVKTQLRFLFCVTGRHVNVHLSERFGWTLTDVCTSEVIYCKKVTVSSLVQTQFAPSKCEKITSVKIHQRRVVPARHARADHC